MIFIVLLWQNSLLAPGLARTVRNVIKYKQLFRTVCSVVKANREVYIFWTWCCIFQKNNLRKLMFLACRYISELQVLDTKPNSNL